MFVTAKAGRQFCSRKNKDVAAKRTLAAANTNLQQQLCTFLLQLFAAAILRILAAIADDTVTASFPPAVRLDPYLCVNTSVGCVAYVGTEKLICLITCTARDFTFWGARDSRVVEVIAVFSTAGK